MTNPLLKYKAYHQDNVNVVIHQVCVPLLLISFYSTVPIYVAFVVNIFYSLNYLLFDVFSTKSVHSVYYLQSLFITHFVFRITFSIQTNILLHITSWALQIVGHRCFEHNTPAFMDNLYDSFLFAPYFTFLETFYPSSFESKDHYTIIKTNYNPTKKSIIYFAGLFQRAQSEYKNIATDLPFHNHIYINTNFTDGDIFKDKLVNIIEELGELDIECVVGFSFGGSLALQFKQICDKDVKTILISPAGFQSSTFVENSIRTVGRVLYSLYCNDKWYMIQNYPTYQNSNTLSDTDYIVVSTSDTIHNPLAIKNHIHCITLKRVAHLSMIGEVGKQRILAQMVNNEYEPTNVDEKLNHKKNRLRRIIFGGHFYPYQVALWLHVSVYNLYSSVMNGYSCLDYVYYGTITWIICGFNEYVFHRIVMHHFFSKHHGEHHKRPNKVSLIHTPMVLMIGLIGITYMTIHVCTNQKVLLISCIFGPIYYLMFEITHALTHTYKGTSTTLINVKQYHKLHHIDENTNYGFLTPMWDYVFGTLSPNYPMHFIELLFGFIPFYSFFVRGD